MENKTTNGSQPQPQPENFLKGKNSPLVIGLAVAVVVIIGLGAAVGFYRGRVAVKNSRQQAGLIGSQPQPKHSSAADSGATSTAPDGAVQEHTASSSQGSFAAGSGDCMNSGPVPASVSGVVAWQKPSLVPDQIFIIDPASPDSDFAQETSYTVGHFISGKYAGGDLLVTFLQYDEPGGPVVYRAVRQGKKYTVLQRYSDQYGPDSRIISPYQVSADADFDLIDLDFPPVLHPLILSGGAVYPEHMGMFKQGSQFFCADNLTKAFIDPVVGDVYIEQQSAQPRFSYPAGGLYVKGPDGMAYAYQISLNFMNGKTPLVTWANGIKNTKEYDYQAAGGCGSGTFLNIASVQPADLVQVGTTLTGTSVYGYKSAQNQDLKTVYDGIYQPDGTAKISYQDFIASHPVFFWQDPFGRFIEFKSVEYQPMAECGKPVIYLYPEKTEPVFVTVSPQGGLIKSDPAYAGGWHVIADSDGLLHDRDTAQTYPYLFWEGRGSYYKTPTKGFMVARENIHDFLSEKLALLGLNDKESADFMEFWEPKMNAAPYYFVTFMGNRVMDELAPLSVTPKPDTVIRVLMDFTPLAQPVPVEGYDIHTPKRTGFTVVEWGGVLR